MRIVKQSLSLPVAINHDSTTRERKTFRHSKLLPDTIRCIICGPSNCGKTNLALNLLFQRNGIKFANLYLFTKSLQQEKYRLLKKVLEKTKQIGFFPFTDNDEVISSSEAKPNSVFIFDDVICQKQKKMQEFFSMGRHHLCDSIYIGQSYAKLEKHLLRDNSNIIVLFKQDEMNLRHIFHDHVSPDMTFDMFKKMCAECWQPKYGVLVIVKDNELNGGRYRMGFDKYIYL